MSTTPVWVVNGEAYDLSDFISKHPGGKLFIDKSRNRDVSVIVRTYHPNRSKVLAVLSKYHVRTANPPQDIARDLCVPGFLLPENFDARHDLASYKHNGAKDLQTAVIQDIEQSGLKHHLKRMDHIFDMVTCMLCLLHFILFCLFYYSAIPTWVSVIGMVLTRTAIAGSGHYQVHRKIPNWGNPLFDINYLGISFLAFDGHTMLHHMHLRYGGDVKISFFSGLMCLPRLLRVPIHTLHRFGLFLTGLFLRSFIIFTKLSKELGLSTALNNFVPYWLMRIYLLLEFYLAISQGLFWAWLAQFVLTLWWNMFLVVASHSLDEAEKYIPSKENADWGLFQIQNSIDIAISGNLWLDLFLSAGLSPHRVHHLLPFQKSGFANLMCMDRVQKISKEYGIEWVSPANFWLDRLPKIISKKLLSPARLPGLKYTNLWQEHVCVEALESTVKHVIMGFLGEGAV